MNTPDTPLAWPDGFPPTDRWKKFFYGIRRLGPDISFFKLLREQQAARTEAVMIAWPDDRQRRIALQLGGCISTAIRWKTPYFIPSDRAVVVVYGPKFLDLDELRFEEATQEFERHVGRRLRKGFWETVVDWRDKNVLFGELIRKLVEALYSMPPPVGRP